MRRQTEARLGAGKVSQHFHMRMVTKPAGRGSVNYVVNAGAKMDVASVNELSPLVDLGCGGSSPKHVSVLRYERRSRNDRNGMRGIQLGFQQTKKDIRVGTGCKQPLKTLHLFEYVLSFRRFDPFESCLRVIIGIAVDPGRANVEISRIFKKLGGQGIDVGTLRGDPPHRQGWKSSLQRRQSRRRIELCIGWMRAAGDV